jgi:hypothetical protein
MSEIYTDSVSEFRGYEYALPVGGYSELSSKKSTRLRNPTRQKRWRVLLFGAMAGRLV